MSGYKTHWQVGTDHAGIATEMVVERQLLEAGKNKKELGREKFEQEVWNWKNNLAIPSLINLEGWVLAWIGSLSDLLMMRTTKML